MSHPTTNTRTYFAVYAALLLLTATTVFLSELELGRWEIPIALGIASVKTILVGLFFMHLLHSGKLTWLVIAAGVLFLAIMLGLTLSDYWTRDWIPLRTM